MKKPDENADGLELDLLVLGTGGAGVAAAIQAATMGGTVGIAEGGTLGGTCVNVGCIPSKALIATAEQLHIARSPLPGVGACDPTLNWQQVREAKDALVAGLRQAKYADVLASYPGISRLAGHARLLSDTDDGIRFRAGDVNGVARGVVVATGATPAIPQIPGIEKVDPLTSTTVMALDVLPPSIIVLGGGPVGVELGQMLSRFGVRVTLLQRRERLLPGEDPEIADLLRQYLTDDGMEIHTGIQATGVERSDDGGVIVRVQRGSLLGEFRASRLFLATGRAPTTADFGLESVGVQLTATGHVKVDATLATSNKKVFAAGDVTDLPAYVYVAAAAGRIAAENALTDGAREFDLSAVPGVTFADPQVASVGFTEQSARDAGHSVQVSRLEMSQVPRAVVNRDTRGLLKLVAEGGTGRLLGAHIISAHAGEIINEATVAVRLGLTIHDLTNTLHAYLTWGESMKLAAQGFTSDVKRLSCCA